MAALLLLLYVCTLAHMFLTFVLEAFIFLFLGFCFFVQYSTIQSLQLQGLKLLL